QGADEVLLFTARGQHDDGRGAALPQARTDLETRCTGHVDVEDDEVRGLRVIARDGLDAISRLDDQIAGLAQRVGDEVEQVRIIVGDEDLHAGSAGRVSVKRVRSSGVRIATSLPPWRSAMDREIDSPRPMPLGAGSTPPRLKRSNTDSSAPS